MKYDFWGRLKMLLRRNRCRSCCFFCEYYDQCRMDESLEEQEEAIKREIAFWADMITEEVTNDGEEE